MSLSEEVLADARRQRKSPILETEQLTLRPPCPEDIQAIAVLADDRRIAENTARIPHPFGVGDAERFVATANKRAGEACFVIMRDDTLIGACGVDPREDGVEIGYWLGAPHWGQGYAAEAVRAVIDHAFGDLTMRRCWPARASAIRRRAGCWKNAPSNGRVSACPASAPSISPRRSTASGSSASSGFRSSAGARCGAWREGRGIKRH